jgi:outer membrane protein OmpA-like peptidoglycan-associated protein
MRFRLAFLIVLTAPILAFAQNGEIQQPKGSWQTPGEIQQPKGPWLTPKEIRQPTGLWQKPGEIQVPKGIQAVHTINKGCEHRLSVIGDALFDFDKASLRPDAEETLAAAVPEIGKLGGKAARIEGHTDAIGNDSYNMKLSEARAATVRDWLATHNVVPAATPIKGYGKTKPIAPNVTSDGKDDPAGRQKNRRVEVVFSTCT